MNDNLLKVFYNQVMFFSTNGTEWIESPNIMISEIHKFSGESREKVIELFKKLREIGFLEKVPGTKYAHRIKNNLSLDKLQGLM